MPQELVVITPENAEIRVPLAGTFSRAAAFVHDFCLQMIGLIFLEIVIVIIVDKLRYSLFPLFGRDLFNGLNMLIVFFWIYGYYPFFELRNNGQTPGKKAHGIRVIGSNGQKVRLFSSLLRNFLRIADFVPFFFLAGLFSSLMTHRNQRLGDIFAGTVVIREEKTEETR